MFVFACPIIDRSQCWLLLSEQISTNIRICPRMSVFASEFNFGVCAMVSKSTLGKRVHIIVFQSN